MKSECLKLDPEMAKIIDLHSNFQGVIITPLVGLIELLTVELFFLFFVLTPEKEFKELFFRNKVTPKY